MILELTAAPLVLHSYVLLVLAGVLMELTLVAVVLSITAAHCLLGFPLAAEGAHALSWQAIRRLDTGTAVAAGHVSAGVLQRCRREQTWKQGLVKSSDVLVFQKYTSTSWSLGHSMLLHTEQHEGWQAIFFKWLVHFWKLSAVVGWKNYLTPLSTDALPRLSHHTNKLRFIFNMNWLRSFAFATQSLLLCLGML